MTKARHIGLVAALAFGGLGAACAPGRNSSVPDFTGGATGTAGTSASAGTSGASSGQGGSSIDTPTGTVTGAAGTSFGTAGSGAGTAGTTGAAGTGFTGSAGSSSSMDASADGSFDGGAPSCQIDIVALAPGTTDTARAQGIDGLEADPSASLRLKAKVSGFVADAGTPRWTWTANAHEDTGALKRLTPVTVGDAGDVIDIPTTSPGSYQVTASNGLPGCAQGFKTIVVTAPQPPTFLFRVTPPAAAQLPTYEVSVDGTNPGAVTELALADSQLLRIAPADARGVPLAAYVRITSASLGFGVEGYTGRGPFVEPLANAFTYRVLLIPDDALAPLLLTGSPDDIRAALKPAFGGGVPVTGTARDADQKPVAGTRVVLQQGERPSTVGVSGADGSFSLVTREGTLSADILPPEGSGLPEARVGGSPGILLPMGAAQLSLSMTWAKVPTGALSVSVKDSAGGPVRGARVRAVLAGTPPAVGTLSVHAPGVNDVSLTATGSALAQGTTDDAGVARLGDLPAGPYHLTVAPPDGLASAAITSADVTLPVTGLAARVPLAAPVILAGVLTPAALSAGAKVTAIDHGPLSAVTMPTATVDTTGAYTLALAAGRTYELLVEPARSGLLGRSVVAVVPPTFTGGPQSNAVATARAWTGSVKVAGRTVAGALVQVYCVRPPASCLDPALALAQGTTAADGTVTLTLPGLPSSR